MNNCINCDEQCYIIDFECVTKYTPLNSSANHEDVITSINLAQIELKGLIGDCYEQLCEEITKDEPDDEFIKLKQLLTPSLSWRVFKYWVEFYAQFEYGSNVSVLEEFQRLSSIRSNDARSLKKNIDNVIAVQDNLLKNNLENLNLICLQEECNCSPCEDGNYYDGKFYYYDKYCTNKCDSQSGTFDDICSISII